MNAERVPIVCPHCASSLVTKHWRDKDYQWCEQCRCTVVFIADEEMT